MIYLFLGQYKKTLQKANQLVEALVKKQPEVMVLKFNIENFNYKNIDDLIATQGLFFSKNIIVLSKIFDEIENKEGVVKNLKEIQASQNIFIFIEESLDKKILEKFEKFSEKIQEVKGEEKKAAMPFNMFSLTDA